MPNIIPIRDIRDTSKISEMCHATDEPIFVAKNRYGDMVLMSIATYESHMARLKIHDKIMQGAQQAEEGKLIDGDSALASLRFKCIR